jgi:single-stranded-DNA-specific exonuclease
MVPATERLARAILNREKIVVYGDYDADGVTATALMTIFLESLEANVEAYIPNRFDEGYGLNNDALNELTDAGANLVLTVDCGIRSVAEVNHGNQLGLDIIITDHHHVGDTIPPALAVINPKQPDCDYPFKELAGVGLAFKLAQALECNEILQARCRKAGQCAADFVDLVAVGTVADLAPLYGENRKLVQQGLLALNQRLRPGLAALMGQASTRTNGAITARTIGFTIGPRLNAAGRLDSALAAFRLLRAKYANEAGPLARDLDEQNRERQALTEYMVERAREEIKNDLGEGLLYFIGDREFNPGIVGLVASRLADEFYRPVLVAEEGFDVTKGSARSIAEFHITKALDQCADLLVRYGGHAAAAGFTIENKNVSEFKTRLQEIAGEQLASADLRPTLTIDGEVNLRGVRPALVEAIDTLRPFGYGNPTPRFVTKNLTVKGAKAVGRDKKHLRLTLNDGKQDWRGIAFNQGEWDGHLEPGQSVNVVYSLEFNEWGGERTMQLNIKDLKPNEA